MGQRRGYLLCCGGQTGSGPAPQGETNTVKSQQPSAPQTTEETAIAHVTEVSITVILTLSCAYNQMYIGH